MQLPMTKAKATRMYRDGIEAEMMKTQEAITIQGSGKRRVSFVCVCVVSGLEGGAYDDDGRRRVLVETTAIAYWSICCLFRSKSVTEK
jgi:hypothetical protein